MSDASDYDQTALAGRLQEIWRSTAIRLLHKSYDLINPASLPGLGHIRDSEQWWGYLQAQYGRKDEEGVAQCEIPRTLSEAPVDIGIEAAALQRRLRGAPLLRSPDTAAPTKDAVSGRDDWTLYQPRAG